ncbi:MAG: hypothetical protein EX263_09370 [Flavobacteriaceae bacterium]|nr:hypothetical protein [Flavobacteriaceae bacterium]NNK60160.1 hypothetical protein [Flavobacteriaceae bacterium]RZW46253.1 MAG: hypothetical protein EX263_09370 [Flavobacteriaceae bacterium]
MAYNEELVNRIRKQLQLYSEDFSEKKMFGGITFLYRGKITVGIIKNELVVRVIPSKMATELDSEYARPMDFTKRPMKEFIYVSKNGFKTETQLLHYIELGLEHAKSKL